MADIRKTYVIAAPVDAVWAALTQPADIDAWGGGPSTMAAEPGFAFSLWGGDVHGTVTEVEPGTSMTQEWFGGDWAAPSIARFALSSEPDGVTVLALEQTGVPESEAADIDAGWDEYYLGPLSSLAETHARKAG